MAKLPILSKKNKVHRIYCVIGRTASGKSTIVNETARQLNMNVLKSYTTRAMRENETVEDSDHIFITQDEVEQYRDDMCAYTERIGYCSFATRQQLLENDFYIINPTGLYELKLKTKDMNIEIVAIYVTVPYRTNLERAKKRGDLKSWEENYDREKSEFKDFEKSNIIDYRILNDGSLKESVEKMINIIKKDKKGEK